MQRLDSYCFSTILGQCSEAKERMFEVCKISDVFGIAWHISFKHQKEDVELKCGIGCYPKMTNRASALQSKCRLENPTLFASSHRVLPLMPGVLGAICWVSKRC